MREFERIPQHAARVLGVDRLSRQDRRDGLVPQLLGAACPAGALGLVLLEHPAAENVVVAELRRAERLAHGRQRLALQRLLGDDALAHAPELLMAEPVLAHEQVPVDAAMHERARVFQRLGRHDHVLRVLAAQDHPSEARDDRRDRVDGLLRHLGVGAELGHPVVDALRDHGGVRRRARLQAERGRSHGLRHLGRQALLRLYRHGVRPLLALEANHTCAAVGDPQSRPCVLALANRPESRGLRILAPWTWRSAKLERAVPGPVAAATYVRRTSRSARG